MFFGITKITFDIDSKTIHDRKKMRSLCDGIQKRFKVSAQPIGDPEEEGEASVAIAALAPSEKQMTTLLDNISDFCENSGFGRVASEEALVDHVDSIGENFPDDN